MIDKNLINWLLDGDPSIKYQVYRDLLKKDKPNIQEEISTTGWGAKFLSLQNKNGHWGIAFYQPKWISTHYTLLDLKNLSISQDEKSLQVIVKSILENEMNKTFKKKYEMIVNEDICINGMVLNYASYFKADIDLLKQLVDYLIENQMSDGGFNCQSPRKGAVHSSLHSTLSVLEGITEYKRNGYHYKIKELIKIQKECIEFILIHKLFKSDKTDKIISNNFTRIPYPPRWKYDILRCLDYLQYANIKYDVRMQDALDLLVSKRKSNGFWNLQAPYPGKVHFTMEKAGEPSRWNTLRALRVLKYFKQL